MATSVAAPTTGAVDAGSAKSKWTRVATLGFLLIATGMALWVVGGMIAGMSPTGDELMFPGGAVVVALIGAAVVSKLGTAGKAIGIVLALAIMVMMFWVAFSLSAPSAFVEFSGAVMFVMGAFTAIGYSIGGLVRRNELHSEATKGETRAMRVMLGIAAVALVVSGVLNLTGRASVAAPAGSVAVTMSEFEFEPGTLQATAGQDTQLVVHNADAFTHDFAIPALDIESGLVSPGSDKLVTVNAPAGTYAVYCNLHSMDTSKDVPSEEDMGALLTVE